MFVSMTPYLCAFPATGDLPVIEALGFRGVRFDVRDAGQVSAIGNLKAHPRLTPLCIVNKYDLVIPVAEEIMRLGRGAIELVNEPNLNGWSPKDWATFTKQAYPAIKAEGSIPVVSGGVSNVGHAQLDYLRQAFDAGLQCDVVGFHRYKTESAPSVPHKDYHSRSEEFQAVKLSAKGKPIACTETGWHTVQQSSVKLTDEQVAEYALAEYHQQMLGGSTLMAYYQITDGPGDGYENHFGIRRMDGSLKPVAFVWCGLGGNA